MPYWVPGEQSTTDGERGTSASMPSLSDSARQAKRLRAAVERHFPPGMLLDSSWDIMIELFIANCENKTLCVKHLILSSGESSTSALRRIDRLEAAGIILRRDDVLDHRRVLVELTHKGEQAMQDMLHALIVER
jgi:DNA-binding MarR family transcriptional regulator